MRRPTFESSIRFCKVKNSTQMGLTCAAGCRNWARLNGAKIQAPWKLPESELRQAGVELGRTYPHPIVDHSFARLRALAALAASKAVQSEHER